jgi:hypothetical protein
VLFVGALVLPYIAVVMANASRAPSGAPPLRVFVRPRRTEITDRE